MSWTWKMLMDICKKENIGNNENSQKLYKLINKT